MSFLDDLKGLVNKGASTIRGLGDDLSHDLKDGITAVESEVNAVKQKLDQDAATLEQDLASVLAQAADGWKKYSADVDAIRSAVSDWASSSDTQAAHATLKASAQSHAMDQDNTWSIMSTMHQNLSSAAQSKSSSSTPSKILSDFDTFSYCFGGDAEIIAAFDGDAGYAIKSGKADYRFVADLSAGMGADVDVNVDALAGFFKPSPDDLKGAFFSVNAGAGAGGSVAASAIFEFPSMDLIGFVFAVGAGAGFSFDTKLGYTMAWKWPASVTGQ